MIGVIYSLTYLGGHLMNEHGPNAWNEGEQRVPSNAHRVSMEWQSVNRHSIDIGGIEIKWKKKSRKKEACKLETKCVKESVKLGKGSWWRFQPDCLPFAIGLFKDFCFMESQMQFHLHSSNSWWKCPLHGFNAMGRQISWKIHYKPLPIVDILWKAGIMLMDE